MIKKTSHVLIQTDFKRVYAGVSVFLEQNDTNRSLFLYLLRYFFIILNGCHIVCLMPFKNMFRVQNHWSVDDCTCSNSCT